jgi:hypothetical protein
VQAATTTASERAAILAVRMVASRLMMQCYIARRAAVNRD